MFEVDQSVMFLSSGLLLLLVLWGLQYHRQKQLCSELNQIIFHLKEDIVAQKQLIDTQMQDLTTQMVNHAALNERTQHAEKNIESLTVHLSEKERLIHTLNAELSDYKSEVTKLETTLTEERKSSIEKLQFIDDAKAKLGNEFKVLANQIFEEKGKKFDQQNRNSLDEVLKPMREQLGDFRKRVDEIHTDDSKERASLREHLAQLKDLNQQMSADALNLTQALKGESKAQGNWGEMILERILETSGLREGHEFAREQSFTGEDGKRLRPDVVIYMPGDKQVIIDSKVSLTDYERAVSASDDAERKVALTAHLRSMKTHIQGLSAKRYDHLPNVHSPDYVLMFMPIEGAYLMAIEADSSIFEAAFEQRVAVVTPSTLYATLKLIEQLWRYERQSENVVKLIDRASKLHDKMVTFVESFEDVGKRLGQARDSYDIALTRIKMGPGNVINQIATLGVLAGKTKKDLPKHLVDDAAIQNQHEISDKD
ncbi:DNA recombination protein RmuC [Mariprofundus ferrooxydans]|nr:DNA recombination protein RmuC [Mariprofundus ferrooxydans]